MSNKQVIDANPTKDFFIRMLTKDIPLIRAIIDLVDNSVDGALREHPDKNFAGLWVKLSIDETKFVIEDNCGGIPTDIARQYAFRFGRPDGAASTPNSVGLFGVGMKRAIFKMGGYFEVESKTQESHFRVRQNIEEWRKLDEWEFQLEDITSSNQSLKEEGTRITVSELYPVISEQFKLENFLITLRIQLEAAQQISIENGLVITVNGKPLEATMLYLCQSEKVVPGYAHFTLDAFPDVSVKIYTGIYKRDLVKGGWYLFCNSRLVLFADQTSETGWDDSGGLPKYHPDFAYSRGYVYFESSDASLLPWNTTKTGVDTDSPIFKMVRQQMIALMLPVTKWLRSSLAEEKKESGEEGELHLALAATKEVSVSELKIAPQSFSAPSFVRTTDPSFASIQYKVSAERAERVRKQLGVKSNSELGRETFEYYYKLECED
jgi:hypothetical protein